MDNPGATESQQIEHACIMVDTLLTSLGLKHVFMGGYQLVVLGAARKSRDVDIEICLPGGKKDMEFIREALLRRRDFEAFDQSTSDNLRGLWCDYIGLDIIVPTQSIMHSAYPITVTDSNSSSSRSLPFMPLTDLLVSKITTAAARFKWADGYDIEFLTSANPLVQQMLRSRGFNFERVCKSLPHLMYDRAARHHPGLSHILKHMQRMRVALLNPPSGLIQDNAPTMASPTRSGISTFMTPSHAFGLKGLPPPINNKYPRIAGAMYGLANTLLGLQDAASSQTTLVDTSSIRSHGSARSSSSTESWGSSVTLVSNGSDGETLAGDCDSVLELEYTALESDEEDEVPIEDHRGYRQVFVTLVYYR
ncbi:hypothetical protein DL93DRAFT_2163928 [Clavulina sp. PMI_390]|nr:hypothetical protein DL93DRAFT_2163928 [Clavulina sp. PMI_390]